MGDHRINRISPLSASDRERTSFFFKFSVVWAFQLQRKKVSRVSICNYQSGNQLIPEKYIEVTCPVPILLKLYMNM